MLRALFETTDDAGTVVCVVGVGTGVDVHEMICERAIDEHRERACGGGDGLGLADAKGHPPIQGA